MVPTALHLTLGLGMPAGAEWVVIMLALLLLFGKRLPEIMRGLGGSVKEFKRGLEDASPAPSPPPVPPPAAHVPDTIVVDAKTQNASTQTSAGFGQDRRSSKS